MLLQTHISRLVEGVIPPSWEDEMAAEEGRHKIGGKKKRKSRIVDEDDS
jgi:hypothetical protein